MAQDTADRVRELAAELHEAERRNDAPRARALRAELARIGMRARPPAREAAQRVMRHGEVR